MKKLRDAASKLKSAGTWHGTGLEVDAKKDHYVYELLCFFHVGLEASSKFAIAVAGRVDIGGKGRPSARWPKSPGLKENFSYLRLTSKAGDGIAFQLCPGIKVVDKDGTTRAPDISLLRSAASEQPVYKDLHACWDAKYKLKSADRLAGVDVSDFIFTFQQLGSPSPPGGWASSVEMSVFVQSGLITNGQYSCEHDQTLMQCGISETATFPDKPKTRP